MKHSDNNRRSDREFADVIRAKRSMMRGRGILAILCLALLASEAISLGVSHKHLWQLKPIAADVLTGDRREAGKRDDVDVKMRTGTSVVPSTALLAPAPLSSASPFDLNTDVIAGGGGNSSAGDFSVEGTIGEPLAGNVATGGDFAQGSGFWYAASSESLPSPTATPTPTPTPSPTPTPTPDPGCISVSVPTGFTALHNAAVSVPVNVSDTTGQGIISFDFTLTYDPSVLAFQSTDQSSTLSSGFTVTVNGNTPGQVVVSGFGTSPLSGTGTLLKIDFNVGGSAPSCSNLNLTSFKFNEGTPCTTTTNGQMCVINGTISGSVSYAVSDGPIAVLKPVRGVNLSAAGLPNRNSVTDVGGTYVLSNLGAGPYTVTPSKTDDVNGIISFDAALTAQQVVGLIILSPYQQTAADTSNDGAVTSFDAALIAQYAVGTANPESIAGTWKFVLASRTYPDTTFDTPAQNYDAILIGDVSGDWAPTVVVGAPQPEGIQGVDAASISVSLPQTSGAHGATITIPITSGDVSAQNVISYDLDIAFDPNVLQPRSSATSSAGTLSNGMNITVNTSIAGHVRVAAFGTMPITGAGSLLNLNFTVIGTPGASTPLTAQVFQYNEGTPQVTKTNGQLSVVSPTATVGTVKGTITKADGTPVAGVVIQLGGAASRKMITDAAGNYHFDNLDPNGLYTAIPSHANYVFGPPIRSFSLSGNQTDASFTASSNGIVRNPLDTPEYFVRQHYLDFLSREPDEAGFNFWSDEILKCGNDVACIEASRVNISAAYFLSIEFQETGYLVYRMNKAAYGNLPRAPVPVRFNEFMPDVRLIRQGVIVLQSGWQQQLESNKQSFANEFVSRSRFTNLYGAMSDAQFIDALNLNINGVLSVSERAGLVAALASGARTRAQVLRLVAENEELSRQEFNKAFVLMEYFGYLRRDPNSGQDSDFTGYDFWLAKLNQFHGNFQQAEMVKAFIESIEYRDRFPR